MSAEVQEAGPSRCTTAATTLNDEPGTLPAKNQRHSGTAGGDSLETHQAVTDLTVADKVGPEPLNVPPISTLGSLEAGRKADRAEVATAPGKTSRRWFLLFIFSLAAFLDVCCRSGVILFTPDIMDDLNILYESSTWIPTSFSVPFACFLLFWGRICDLFSPKWVFVFGFYALGITCVIVSCCPDMYSFFVFRGLCGLFCSATIPAAFRLIMVSFSGKERGTAITVFTLSGAVANACGFILAAFFSFISASGQMSGWRWYFRLISVLAIIFASLAIFSIPTFRGSQNALSRAERWRRFDLPGCVIMFGGTLLFMLSLTLGATYGWKTAKFLVPFLLSFPLWAAFFLWERTLKPGHALIPPETWKIRNVSLLLVVGITAFSYFPGTQLPLIEVWQEIYHEKSIIAAVRLIPQGIASVVPMMILPYIPQRAKSSRWFIVGPYLINAFMLLLVIESHGSVVGSGYWRFCFPSFIIAGFFSAWSITGISVSVMLSVPDSMSAVAGALLQLGGAATFAIQAGLLTTYPGSISNFHNVQASWWFFAGWYTLSALAVAVMYRDPKAAKADGEARLEAKAEEAVKRVEGSDEKEHEGEAEIDGEERDTAGPGVWHTQSRTELGKALSRVQSIP